MSNAFLPNPWHDEANLKRLVDMWTHGATASEIAKRIPGATRNAVIGKVYRMRLERHPAAELDGRQQAGRGLTRVSRKPKPKVKAPPKPEPVRKVVGGSPAAAILRRAEAEPIPLPELREAPVSLLHAKPWTERMAGQCTWPVSGSGADTLSCCAPVFKRGWCKGHFKIGCEPLRETARRYESRMARAA